MSTDFIPHSIEPIGDSLVLISGPQTCVYNCRSNAATHQSPLQNAVWSEQDKSVYGFCKGRNAVVKCAADLKALNSVEFECSRSLELTHCQVFKNLLVLSNKEKTSICIYCTKTNKILCAINRDIAESIVYITQHGLIGVQLGEGGRAAIEKGIFCTNLELYHNYIKRTKLEEAMHLCLGEVELHSLSILHPLLINLTRRRKILKIEERVLSSQQFKDFLNLVDKLEKRQPNNVREAPSKRHKAEDNGYLWANVVFNMLAKTRPKELDIEEQAKALLKNQREYRTAARWRLYLAWYKHTFLGYFPCMQSAPERIVREAHSAKRVLKRTINFLLRNTPEEQVVAIGEERMLEDYRVFKWMMRKIIATRNGLDYTIILQNRMNEQVFRIMSIPFIKIAMRLAKESGEELGREVNRSYFRMKQAILRYSL